MKRIKAHIIKNPCNSPLTCPAGHSGVPHCAWGCLAYVKYRLKVEAARRANIKYQNLLEKRKEQKEKTIIFHTSVNTSDLENFLEKFGERVDTNDINTPLPPIILI